MLFMIITFLTCLLLVINLCGLRAGTNDSKEARLDRVLVSSSWQLLYPNVTLSLITHHSYSNLIPCRGANLMVVFVLTMPSYLSLNFFFFERKKKLALLSSFKYHG